LSYDRGEAAVSYITDEPVEFEKKPNRLKFKTAGKLLIILEEFVEEYTPIQ